MMRLAFLAGLLLFIGASMACLGQETLSRRTSISGKVIPDLTDVWLGLARYGYDEDGEPRLVKAGAVRTSREIGKFGEYRFENVEPGEYYLYFSPPPVFSPSAPAGEIFPTIYYPGASDLATASRIVVKDGASVQLGDLNFFSVPASTIRIHLVNATGYKDAPKRCATVILIQRDTPGDPSNPPLFTRCAAGGEFSDLNAGGLAPGMYDMYAGWQANSNGGPTEGAVVSFEARNLSMEIEVVVSRARMTGTIVMEDSEGTLRPARGVVINLKPRHVGPTEYVETDTNGLFRHDKYVVEFPNLPPEAYVARLVQDKRDVLENGLDVQSTDLHMDGLISFNGGMIEGTLSDSNGGGVAGAVVALVPDARLQKHLYQAVKSSGDGRFVFRSIPPGSYQLFAWSTLNGGAFKNSQFMKQYEGRGQPATVEKKGRLTIPIKLLD